MLSVANGFEGEDFLDSGRGCGHGPQYWPHKIGNAGHPTKSNDGDITWRESGPKGTGMSMPR